MQYLIKETYKEFYNNIIKLDKSDSPEFPIDLIVPYSEEKLQKTLILASGTETLQTVYSTDYLSLPTYDTFCITGIDSEDAKDQLEKFKEDTIKMFYDLYLKLDLNVFPIVCIYEKPDLCSLYFGCLEEREKDTLRRFKREVVKEKNDDNTRS